MAAGRAFPILVLVFVAFFVFKIRGGTTALPTRTPLPAPQAVKPVATPTAPTSKPQQQQNSFTRTPQTAQTAPPPPSAPPNNFLFISVDDLRAELGGLGFPHMITPHFDRLIATSLNFRRMYVQFPVCGPSRTSMLTGRRPDMTHVTDLTTYFRAVGCNVTTLPQYFRKRNFYVAGSGKIFHPRKSSGLGYFGNTSSDDPPSWTAPFNVPDGGEYRAIKKTWFTGGLEKDHPDAKTAAYIIRRMEYASKELKKPFFLMAGFEKPHLPFAMPQSYLDMYPLSNISLPDNYEEPEKFPSVAWSVGGIGEFKLYEDIKELRLSRGMSARFPKEKVLDLRRAYRACVTFIDAQIGKLLDAVDDLGLANTTTIVLWSDHGYHLGEHAAWAKHSAFENDARVPFTIRAPKYANGGRNSYKIVETVDIFPTLVDLAGFPIPTGLQGRSLVPLLADPNDAQWNNAVALTQVLHDWQSKDWMGYSIRTPDWRYTEWVLWNETTKKMDWTRVPGKELYDHRGNLGTSFESWENDNVVDVYPYSAQTKMLSAMLRSMVNANTRPVGQTCVDVFDPTKTKAKV